MRVSFSLLASLSLACIMTIILLNTPSEVDGRSTGILTECDLSAVNVTATNIKTSLWPYGRYGMNKTTGAITTQQSATMKWAWWPQPSQFYTLRTSDDSTPNDDVTTYTPGKSTELHLRVLDLDRRWIGLVLYATTGVNVTTKKDIIVGSWSIDAKAALQISQCSTGSPSGNVVTHIDAELKPLHSRFYFSAPKGTGTIRFKMLIKQGEQNKGSFFYLPQELVLTESTNAYTAPVLPTGGATTATGEPVVATNPFVSQSIVGSVGSSCAASCLSRTPATPYCDYSKTLAIKTAATFYSSTGRQLPCRLPLLAGCPYAGVSNIDADGFCTFRTDDLAACPKSYAALNLTGVAQPNVCFTAVKSTSRPVCICSNDRSVQPINPFTPKSRRRLLSLNELGYESSTPVSSAESSKVSMIAFAFTAILSSMFSIKSRSSLLIIASLMIISLASPASAHNYIKSLHRAGTAAVTTPCQERVGNQPHVQVIRDQKFEVQWSLGHNDYPNAYFFALVREDDYDLLRAANITAIITDYLNLNPGNSTLIPAGLNKVHMRAPWEEKQYANGNDIYAWMDNTNLTDTTDPNYFKLDLNYRALAHPFQYGKNDAFIQQMTFKPQHLARDRRASYKSAKYPWILSAALFWNTMPHSIVVDQSDIARFSVPSWATPGNHVLYFNWAGYKDCVDISVLDRSTPIVNRYGLAPNGTTPALAVKIEHAEYFNNGYAASSCRKVDPVTLDVSACLADCKYIQNNYGVTNCMGVQLTRSVNPPGTMKYTPNIPVSQYNYNDSAPGGGPCSALDVHTRTLMGCNRGNGCTGKVNFTEPGYYCFGSVAIRNQDFQVQDDIKISNDPIDPTYYSTLFVLDQPKYFLEIDPDGYQQPSWIDDESCVDCEFQAKLKNVSRSRGSDWVGKVTSVDKCYDCRVQQMNSTFAVAQSKIVGANQQKVGRLDAAPYGPSSSSSTGSAQSSSSSTGVASSSSSSTGSNAEQAAVVETEYKEIETQLTEASATLSDESVGKIIEVNSTSTRYIGLQRFNATSDAPVTVTIPVPDSSSTIALSINTPSSSSLVAQNDAHFIVANPNPFAFAPSATDSESTVIAGSSSVSVDITDVTGKSVGLTRLAAPIVGYSYSVTQSYSSEACPAESCEPVCKFYDDATISWVNGDLITSVNSSSSTVKCTTSTPGSIGLLTSKISNNNVDSDSSSSSGLSSLAIGLIIAGGVLVVLIIGVVIFFAVRSSASSGNASTMKQMAAETHQPHRSSVAMA